MSDQWYYGESGQQRGPASIDELRQRVASGAIRGEDLVWREGMPNWTPAANVPELADVLGAAPAGPPPTNPPPQAHAHYPPAYAGYDPEAARLEKSASSALTFGIIALVGAFCCAPIGVGFGIAAIVKGMNARGAPNRGTATGAIICGAVGLLLGLASFVVGIQRGPILLEQIRQQQQQVNPGPAAPAGR